MSSFDPSPQTEYLLYRIDQLRRRDNHREGRIVIAMARCPGVGKTEICADILHHSAAMGHDDIVIVPQYIYMSPQWRRWPGYYLYNTLSDEDHEDMDCFEIGAMENFDMKRSRDDATLIAARAHEICQSRREEREVLRLPIQPVFPDEDQTFAPTVWIERHHRIVIFVGSWFLHCNWGSSSLELAHIADERWFVECTRRKMKKRLLARFSLWSAPYFERQMFLTNARESMLKIEQNIRRVERARPKGYIVRLYDPGWRR